MTWEEEEEQEAAAIVWDIQREGRAWTAEEFKSRVDRLMELKFEVSRGKLFYSDATRLLILGMLLENVGMEAALGLGNLERWKEALAAASQRMADAQSGSQKT